MPNLPAVMELRRLGSKTGLEALKEQRIILNYYTTLMALHQISTGFF